MAAYSDNQTASGRPLSGTKIGVVTVAKQDKTRTVAVNYQVRHNKYGKYLKRQTKFRVHDPKNVSKLGDTVEIVNCRPISKTKMWRMVRVVQASSGRIGGGDRVPP